MLVLSRKRQESVVVENSGGSENLLQGTVFEIRCRTGSRLSGNSPDEDSAEPDDQPTDEDEVSLKQAPKVDGQAPVETPDGAPANNKETKSNRLRRQAFSLGRA